LSSVGSESSPEAPAKIDSVVLKLSSRSQANGNITIRVSTITSANSARRTPGFT
jgi:hypothetical protein